MEGLLCFGKMITAEIEKLDLAAGREIVELVSFIEYIDQQYDSFGQRWGDSGDGRIQLLQYFSLYYVTNNKYVIN